MRLLVLYLIKYYARFRETTPSEFQALTHPGPPRIGVHVSWASSRGLGSVDMRFLAWPASRSELSESLFCRCAGHQPVK